MKALSPPNTRDGFTLIELMIVVAIAGIFSAAMAPFFRYAHVALLRSRGFSEVGRSWETASAVLGQDIRGAAGVIPTWEGFKSTERCLVLETPSLLPGRRLSTASQDHIVYRQDPNSPRSLVKQVFAAPGSLRAPTRQVLARNLNWLKFSYSPSLPGARLVSFRVSFGSGSGNVAVQGIFSSALGLRNGGPR